MSNKSIGAILSGIVIAAMVGGLAICTEKVPAGYVAVQYSMNGGVKDEVLTQGWHLVSPTTKTTLYSVATEVFAMTEDKREGSKEDESFKVTCRDGEMNVGLEIQYSFDAENVSAVFSKYRGVDGETVVKTNLRSKIKTIVNEVLSEYSVLEAHLEKKTEVNTRLTEVMRERLSEYGIYVDSATLPETKVSSDVQAAIENRTKIAQELEAEKQAQEKAKLEAETKLIKAQADADAKVIAAQAEADANRLLEESITDELIRMTEAEARLKHGWVTVNGASTVVSTNN